MSRSRNQGEQTGETDTGAFTAYCSFPSFWVVESSTKLILHLNQL